MSGEVVSEFLIYTLRFNTRNFGIILGDIREIDKNIYF
jgi:hypothetical protein